MRDLMWRVTAVMLDVSLLALGVLAGWQFRLRRASTPPGSEGLLLVPYWGLPR